MKNCIFCKIVNKEIPCKEVYEDSEILVFLDIQPLSKGHCLVIPKEHCETIDKVNCNVMDIIKKVSKVLLNLNKGLNILQNNRKEAGQVVDHVHFHLIPRNVGDNVNLGLWSPRKYNDDEMESIKVKIKNLLSRE